MGNLCCFWKDRTPPLIDELYGGEFIFNDPPTPRDTDQLSHSTYQYPTVANLPGML